MEDKDLFKLKLQDLPKLCADISGMAEKFEKGLSDLRQQKVTVETAVLAARQEYTDILRKAAAYKEEFERNKKEEHSEMERKRQETRQMHEVAQEKLSGAELIEQKIQDKERYITDKMKEIEEIKNDLLQKREKVKSLVSQI